jgi:hypothetical protein
MSTDGGNPFPTAKTARVCRTDGPICMALVPTSQGTQNPEAILTAAHMHPALSANVLFCRDEVRREPPCAQQVQLKSVRLPALVSQITEPSWPQDVAVSAFVRWLWFTRVCADIVGPSIHEAE